MSSRTMDQRVETCTRLVFTFPLPKVAKVRVSHGEGQQATDALASVLLFKACETMGLLIVFLSKLQYLKGVLL